MVATPPHPIPPPPQPPAQIIPKVTLLYRLGEHGLRHITGISIAGQRFGGIVAVDTGCDMTQPSNLPANVVRLNLETVWPFDWKDEASGPDLIVATGMPR